MFNRPFFKFFVVALAIAVAASACGPEPEKVTGRLTVGDGSKSYSYSFDLPTEWVGKIRMNDLGHAFSIHYDADPAALLFTITCMPHEEWQRAKNETGAGEVLLTLEGTVFILNMGLENPYSGEQGDEFQALAAKVREVTNTISISALR